MALSDRTFIILSIIFVLYQITCITGENFWKITQVQDDKTEDKRIKIIWCTVNWQEQQKCYNWARANDRDHIRVMNDYFSIQCYQATSKDECMKLLDEEKATMTSLDPAEVFVGGRYHSLVPIAQEVLEGNFKHYYAVAVVHKNSLPDVQSLHDLRSKRACFAGVQSFAGWVVPIYTLMQHGGMEIVDCNNHVKTATKFFGPSCAVNCLTDKYNPIGDNSDKLCQICTGKIPGGRCTDADPYAGFSGAFRCLLEKAGDIAFLRHTTVHDTIAGGEFYGVDESGFELLCMDGTRRPVSDYLGCNWGKVPTNTIVTTSASSYELRLKYQLFLEKSAQYYPARKSNYTKDKDEQSNRNYFGNQDGQPEYDSFGNRLNRFKRQDFGAPNYQDQNEYNRNNPYGPTTDQYGKNNPYGSANDQYGRNNPYGSTTDQYNRNNPYGSTDQYGRNNPYDNNDQYGRNTYDQYGRDDTYRRNRTESVYSRDPSFINREQFGQNIDPYVDDPKNRVTTYNLTYNEPDFARFNQTGNETFYEVFDLFESAPRYGYTSNLLFQDGTRRFEKISESEQTYNKFLGEANSVIMGIRQCPINRMTLCVTSDVENEKCVKMRTALKAQLLKPEMDCYKGHSQIHCMQAIRGGTADVAVLDASDVYTAGLQYDLVPFISEVYNLDDPEYYVVAVAKVADPSTDLTYLKGKNTCHGGINTAAGWVYPLAFLISNGWIRPYGCNSIRAAAEYFTKSCVPGALSTEYNTGVPYDNMCDLCHGASYRYCRRDASEVYYGHTGAFRCLVEGGGHVAFVKHTTVNENIGGKREEWWARDNLNEDFELLCPDGTRAPINQYKKCNIGKVKANAIVTRGGYGYNHTHINAFINLFLYAQTFYGRKTSDEFSFSMFSSTPPYTDLIFQDATTQLKVIEPEKRHYADYLGSDFMRARRIVDCHAGSHRIHNNILVIALTSIFLIIFRY